MKFRQDFCNASEYGVCPCEENATIFLKIDKYSFYLKIFIINLKFKRTYCLLTIRNIKLFNSVFETKLFEIQRKNNNICQSL